MLCADPQNRHIRVSTVVRDSQLTSWKWAFVCKAVRVRQTALLASHIEVWCRWLCIFCRQSQACWLYTRIALLRKHVASLIASDVLSMQKNARHPQGSPFGLKPPRKRISPRWLLYLRLRPGTRKAFYLGCQLLVAILLDESANSEDLYVRVAIIRISLSTSGKRV